MSTTSEELIRGIDFRLFRDQKEALIQIVNNLYDPVKLDLMVGLLTLLDYIQYHAAEDLGIPDCQSLDHDDTERTNTATHILINGVWFEKDPAQFLVKGNVMVEWVRRYEGWDGDYDSEDPDDEELLRFDVSVRNPDPDPDDDRNWLEVPDSSYCTRFPKSATKDQKVRGLEMLMNAFYSDVLAGHSVKKIGEEMSWIGVDWLED